MQSFTGQRLLDEQVLLMTILDENIFSSFAKIGSLCSTSKFLKRRHELKRRWARSLPSIRSSDKRLSSLLLLKDEIEPPIEVYKIKSVFTLNRVTYLPPCFLNDAGDLLRNKEEFSRIPVQMHVRYEIEVATASRTVELIFLRVR